MTLNIQSERDPKNGSRFYITIPEVQVAAARITQADLRIEDAEKVLSFVKKKMAEAGAKAIVTASPKLRSQLPQGAAGDAKPYVVKRPKAGSVPAHYRVGLQITFNDPVHAQIFAGSFRIP